LHHVVYTSGYANPSAPRLLMRRLRRLFNRLQLERAEVQILRGLLTTWQQQWRKPEVKS
jgi:tRNA/rRNA methyltransferase